MRTALTTMAALRMARKRSMFHKTYVISIRVTAEDIKATLYYVKQLKSLKNVELFTG